MSIFPTKILLATDGSRDAARAAVDLSGKTGSELHVVHAWHGQPVTAHYPYAKMEKNTLLHELVAQELLEEQTERLEAAGATVAGAHLRRGDPASEVIHLGEELEVGLVVVDSRGLGTIGRLVLGSVSEEVVYLASRPTLVVRGGARAWPPARVVVGEDSSEQAKRAAQISLSIGKLFGARAILVRTAYPEPQPPPPGYHQQTLQRERDVVARMHERRRLKKALEERAGELEETLGLRPRVRTAVKDAAAFILEVAEEEGEEATLVAVGGRGLGKIKSTMLGSVSRKVLRTASGPILISP